MTAGSIFYRDPTSRTLDFATVELLQAARPLQVLEFLLPDNIWQDVDEIYNNNNKKFPIPTSKGGVKKIGISPAGMKNYQRVIRGYFKKGSAAASIATIRRFRKLQQIDTYHEFGIFGMDLGPEASEGFDFSLDDSDPDNTFGWSFDGYTLKNKSIFSNKIYDFSITLGFAGTLP